MRRRRRGPADIFRAAALQPDIAPGEVWTAGLGGPMSKVRNAAWRVPSPAGGHNPWGPGCFGAGGKHSSRRCQPLAWNHQAARPAPCAAPKQPPSQRRGKFQQALLGILLALTIGGTATTASATVPLISIVIDDLGDNWQEGLAAVGLPGPVACAFLPESPHTRHLAERAHAARKEILVHLPLEPIAGKAHPLALSARQDSPERNDWLAEMLTAVPHATGVNNHQGSLATANRGAMHWLMRELSLRGAGYFVDSMTSAASVAYPLARAYGIPATRRRVFLDHQRGEAETRFQFQRLIQIAKQNGGALAIGHPYPETLAVLAQILPRISEYGVELVQPSQLIRRIERRPLVQPVALRLTTSLSPQVSVSAVAMP